MREGCFRILWESVRPATAKVKRQLRLACNCLPLCSTAAWVVLKNGRYDDMPIDCVTSNKKVVDVGAHYNTERLRPYYKNFHMKPLFIMTSD